MGLLYLYSLMIVAEATETCSCLIKYVKAYFTHVLRYMTVNTGLFKMIVGVHLSSGNSGPNSGNNHNLTIPFEGSMRSFKRQGACVSRN